MNDNHFSISNIWLALSTFFIWLYSTFQNHFVGVMTGLILILTALNQYRGWRNRMLDKKIKELEIKKLEE